MRVSFHPSSSIRFIMSLIFKCYLICAALLIVFFHLPLQLLSVSVVDVPLIPQRLPGLQRELNPFLGLFLAAERLEAFAFQVEQILFAYRSAGGDVAAADDLGYLGSYFHVMVADVFCLPH